MADTEDLKSSGPKARAGSSPALGTPFMMSEMSVIDNRLHSSSLIYFCRIHLRSADAEEVAYFLDGGIGDSRRTSRFCLCS
jgi:hypothetical protein